MSADDDATIGDIAALKRASSHGVAISLAAQVVRFILQFVSAVIMARLLSPQEFGVVAMAYPIIAFVQLFVDLGLSQATIQRPRISQAELSFMFWISVAASVAMGVALAVCAPLFGAFYREPRVTMVIVALGLITALAGFYAQHAALLNRRLRFLALGTIDVGSYALGAAAGIVAARSGMSYWSVVVAQGVTTVAALLLYWGFAGWMPSWPAPIAASRRLLGFGGNVTAFNVINYFARNLDNVLIGRYAGETQLGLYDRAYRLLILPLSQVTQPLSRVATPLLARTLDTPDAYRQSYARMLEVALLLTYPAVIFAGIARHDLVRTLLGPQWAGTATIFGIMAIGALFAPVSNSTGWLLTTQDRTREMRDYGMASSVAFVLSFIAGLPSGALGVARCYILVGTIQGPLLWWATTRRGPVSGHDLLGMLTPFALAAIPTAAAMWLIVEFAPGGAATLLGALLLAYIVFATALCTTARGRDLLRLMLRKARIRGR